MGDFPNDYLDAWARSRGIDAASLPSALAALGLPLVSVTDITPLMMQTWNSSPVVLVPAPGPGKAAFWVGGSYQDHVGAIAVGLSGGDAHIQYEGITDDDQALCQNTLTPTNTETLTTLVPSEVAIADPLVFENKAIVAYASADSDPSGAIATSVLNAGGSGYAHNDTGVIGFFAAPYVIDTVDGGGAVLTYHLLNGGAHGSVDTDIQTFVSTGGGDGAFTVDVLTITPATETLRVKAVYSIIDLLA